MFIVFTDCLEKTPSFESDSGIPQWLLEVLIVVGIIIFMSMVTLLGVTKCVRLPQIHIKCSKLHCSC